MRAAKLTGFATGLAVAIFWLDLGPFPIYGLQVGVAPAVPSAADPAVTSASTAAQVPGRSPFRLSDREARCLARTVFFEARGESLRGQLAVAMVVRNRMRHATFPGNACTVIHQVAAFSWYSDGKSDDPTDYRGPANRTAWVSSRRLVDALRRNRMADPTDGADHYHATYVSPDWSRHFAQTAHIGEHLFFRGRR